MSSVFRELYEAFGFWYIFQVLETGFNIINYISDLQPCIFSYPQKSVS